MVVLGMAEAEERKAKGALPTHGFGMQLQREQSQWEKTNGALCCDPFQHLVNKHRNCFNNSHHILRHQSRPLPKPLPLESLTQAYGNRMPPKLVQKLEDSKFHVRQKALAWAVDLLATPEGRMQCFAAGMLPVLVNRLSEEDLFMRQQLACAFKHIAGSQEGCLGMSRLGAIDGLLKMVSSDNEDLRVAALDALHEASFSEPVRLHLVNTESAIPFLMESVRKVSSTSSIVLGMKILQRCLAGGLDKIAVTKLLKVDAVATLVNLMKHIDYHVQEAATRLLCLIGMEKEGKVEVYQRNGVGSLLELLKEDNQDIQTSAAAALMSWFQISQSTLSADLSFKKESLQYSICSVPPSQILKADLLNQLYSNSASNIGLLNVSRMSDVVGHVCTE